jgi:PAS domain S-box-containing protein
MNASECKELKNSETRYRRLFESAKDGILILDFETGNIVDANPFIIKIIDHPLNEILGKKLWEIGLFSNKEESEQAVIELKTNGYIRFEDMPIQRPNGKITEVEFISNVYLANDTKVIQCNIRDITDRKQAEFILKENEQNLKKQNAEYLRLLKEYSILYIELNDSIRQIQKINDELIVAKERAEESDKLKSAFLANISHEIRTPMNAIMGFSDLLLRSDLSKENLADFAQIIKSSSLHLLSVINDIIDISIIESDHIIIDTELVNINNLLNELYITYKETVKLKNIKIYYPNYASSDAIQINTDGNKIKQILCNLLNNAIKFTNKGKIEFGYNLIGNFVEFYVNDTGIGIAPENHKLIFERFRKVDTNNDQLYEGNGLGLSISSALVKKLGGTINVNSELGIGSTFTFTIPLLRETGYIENPVHTNSSNQINNWNEKTILLVEDEEYSHAYIDEILSYTNVKILHAWDGKQAVELVKKHSDISLVLMDIKMPVMDGYEATHFIKEIRPQLPVIAQTAFAYSQDKEQAIEAGCDNYIAKPIERLALMNMISNYLN